MQKETKTVTIACDLCGHETTDLWRSVSEAVPVGMMSITYDVWYGGVYDVKDICRTCQNKLITFMHENKMLYHGQKR